MCLFVIAGVVPRERSVGTETRYCSTCRRETIYTLYERRMWFTFFFIPLIPVSGKEIIARCESCGLDTSQQAMGIKRCPQCGAEAIPEASFCQFCGHNFDY